MVSFSILLGVLGTVTYSLAILVDSFEMAFKYLVTLKLPWLRENTTMNPVRGLEMTLTLNIVFILNWLHFHGQGHLRSLKVILRLFTLFDKFSAIPDSRITHE